MVEKFIADVEENFERLRDFLDNKCESCVALLELANIYQTTRPIIFPVHTCMIQGCFYLDCKLENQKSSSS